MPIVKRHASEDYVEETVANLVNSAPETLDTLGELAIAFEENKDMVATLNAAITTKAEKSDLQDVQESIDTITDYINSNQTQVNEMLKLVYPKGAIYISTIATNPSILFGFGTWEQIQDTFLLAAGNSYIAGSTGGEAKHTLTTNELPSVQGSITMHHAAIGTNINMVDGCFTGDSIVQGSYRQGGTLLNADTASVGKVIYSNGGQNQAHNNMPPYLTVYMWKRVS
jgi:hypothetical protein